MSAEVYGSYDLPGRMTPINLWKFQRNNPEREGNDRWWVGNCGSRTSQEEHRNNLNETCDLLNNLEATIAQQRAEMLEVTEQLKSLRQDLTSFSTFEQICNSGMLRNFKIDSESDFARTILSLLQRTMELQISHLRSEPSPPTKGQSDETATGSMGIHPPADQQSDSTAGSLPAVESTA